MRYHSGMATCSSCGAVRPPTQAPCAKCGTVPPVVPDLELATPPRAAPKPPRPRKEVQEVQIDLAYDPRANFGSRDPSSGTSIPSARPHGLQAPTPSTRALEVRPVNVPAGPPEASSDARLLADYGSLPSHWLLSPLYALRVLQRRRELRRALAARREEASRAATEVEDALVSTAEQVRSVAEQQATFTDVMGALRRAEELLRMRDRVLTAENEAEMARLASADARLSRLQADLAAAQAEERSVAGDLVAAQEALAREETHMKRTEAELRAAQREPSGSRE
jgi:hypothetical protein